MHLQTIYQSINQNTSIRGANHEKFMRMPGILFVCSDGWKNVTEYKHAPAVLYWITLHKKKRTLLVHDILPLEQPNHIQFFIRGFLDSNKFLTNHL